MSQDFIRALKAPSNSLQPGEKSQLEVAREGWENTNLYVPRKEQVIADWILSKFRKDDSSTLDAGMWQLLGDVVIQPQLPVKTWLPPLLNRATVSTAIIALLTNIVDRNSEERRHILDMVCRCLTVIWPLAVRKFNVEILLECLGSLLVALKKGSKSDGMNQLSTWIISAFRSSLSNSSAKKKIYAIFTQMYLLDWAACIDAQGDSVLAGKVYEAGVDIILNVDVLRQLGDGDGNLFEVLRLFPPALLPRLFASYVTAVKRFRGALFGQSSSQQALGGIEEIRVASMRFFLSAQAQLEHRPQDPAYWSAQIELLRVVKEQALYNGQREFEGAVGKIVQHSIGAFQSYSDAESTQESAQHAADTLTAMTNLDYGLIATVVPRILLQLLHIPTISSSYRILLEAILEYHTKTRTVNDLLTLILDLFSRDDISDVVGDLHQALSASVASPMMHPQFLDQVGRGARSFITPTQVLPTLRFVVDCITQRWDAILVIQSAVGDQLKARRKSNPTMAPTNDTVSALEHSAVAFSLACRVAGRVLYASAYGNSADNIRKEYETVLQGFYDHILATTSGAMKILNKWAGSHAKEMQGSSAAVSAMLRLAYTLRQEYPTLTASSEAKATAKLLAFVGDQDKTASFPQLSVEIFRYLLDDIESLDADSCISSVIAYLGNVVATIADDEAFLQVIIERWLPIIDYNASSKQMDAFVRVLVDRMSVSTSTAFRCCMNSADFWELHKVRDSLLAHAENATAAFKQKQPLALTSIEQLNGSVAVFESLSYFPIDYFPRQLNVELVKRALAADVALSCVEKPHDNAEGIRTLVILRTFALRGMTRLAFVDRPVEDIPPFLKHLMLGNPSNHQALRDATMDLVRFYITNVLKSASASSMGELLAIADQTPATTMLVDDSTGVQYLDSLIGSLTQEFASTTFPAEYRSKLRGLHDALRGALQAPVASVASSKTSDSMSVDSTVALLRGWQRVLRLGRWLSGSTGTDEASTLSGPRLCLTYIHIGARLDHRLMEASFSILKEECLARSSDQRDDLLEVLVEVYANLPDIQGLSIDSAMSEVLRKLSVEEYTNITKLTEVRLLGGAPSSVKSRVVSLAILLLQDNPKDTFHIVQVFATLCLTSFGYTSALKDAEVRSQVCRLALFRCRERAATLRSVDVNAVWSVISSVLSGSQRHDRHTSKQVYHDILAIITALIRHRRDLVVQSMPHLGQTLRKLIQLMRRTKPHLGGRQKTIVSDSCPIWWNLQEPLDIEEAKALSRLLETLLSKTIVRTYTITNEGTKAESLAKPFSKHAGFVLLSFIEAATYPLCVLPTNMTKELQPGLFALCEMMNEHDRNALMVTSLDANGKVVFKSLWKDYEKQRYVGRG